MINKNTYQRFLKKISLKNIFKGFIKYKIIIILIILISGVSDFKRSKGQRPK
jgi:hypothetical protein